MTEQLAGVAVALGGGMLSAASLALARLEARTTPRHPITDAFPLVDDDPDLERLIASLD